ncbi:unnamed protein product [Ambrosiozyma monospora]|uniref:Unnamed protein product n=1 Tax=Ambrosiozyma monospora TaxID=43982 RepID=A0ACB5SVF2_AMBMO|nr:unnamed protein product [Ambrosiozyma monospora]
MTTKPHLNWGIIGSGQISSWFVSDLQLDRPEARATHNVVAIGASSNAKGSKFIDEQKLPKTTFVGSYDEVYNHPDVDIIYIGLPHVFHKESALKAITAGKHVLVEKPATVNAKDFKVIADAAKAKGVFLMEAMWLRFRPLILELKELLLKKKELGAIHRIIADFSWDMNIDQLPDDSRLKSNKLGAGALLDIGIYPLTFSRVLLDDKIGKEHTPFKVTGVQTIHHDVDYMTTIVLLYVDQKQAVITSSLYNSSQFEYLRVECEKGTVFIGGNMASLPTQYRIEFKDKSKEEVKKSFPALGQYGWGLFYEADAVAIDIAAGRTENALCPLDESILVLETMDEVRRQGGLVYPQDKE